ncbi:hypothetical protein ACH5RR_032522 [Cinchona calisaya]|uniref:Uncharacterized protein n=1 Tax=Cinchona calisaya TaxID=153742 RepID=A0ABD2YIB6_9GENT
MVADINEGMMDNNVVEANFQDQASNSPSRFATASLGAEGLQLDTMTNSTVALMAVMNVQAAVDPCPTRVLSGELVLISLVASQGNNVNLPTWVVTECSMHGGQLEIVALLILEAISLPIPMKSMHLDST